MTTTHNSDKQENEEKVIEGSIIVVADSHLGLVKKKRKIARAIKSSEIIDHIKKIEKLEDNGALISVPKKFKNIVKKINEIMNKLVGLRPILDEEEKERESKIKRSELLAIIEDIDELRKSMHSMIEVPENIRNIVDQIEKIRSNLVRLGLAPEKEEEKGVYCEPTYLQQFMNWLATLQKEKESSIKLVKWDSEGKEKELVITEKKLVFPEKLILLGDILELWDASDRDIDLCSGSIIQIMSRLDCEKIYIVGNHDFSMCKYVGLEHASFPSGPSNLKFVSSYPEQEEHSLGDCLRALRSCVSFHPEQAWARYKLLTYLRKHPEVKSRKVGEHQYLLLHGHEFDKTFRYVGNLWQVISILRDGAETFGLYSWIILGLFFISLVISALDLIPNTLFMTLILFILAFPKIFASIARPLWNKIKVLTRVGVTRYDPGKNVLKGFWNWWKVKYKREYDKGDPIILYGHTHLAEAISYEVLHNKVNKPGLLASVRSLLRLASSQSKDKSENSMNDTETKPRAKLINVPSWIRDGTLHDQVLRGVFIYIDPDDHNFIGWDWEMCKPFYIPEDIVQKISKVTEEKIQGKEVEEPQPITKKYKKDDLKQIDWPDGLLEKLVNNNIIAT